MKKSKSKFILGLIGKVNAMQNSKFWGLWFLAVLLLILSFLPRIAEFLKVIEQM